MPHHHLNIPHDNNGEQYTVALFDNFFIIAAKDNKLTMHQ